MDTTISRLSLSDQSNVYHTVNISGNAQAVLGNVTSDNFPSSHGSNVDWKNTLKALYFDGMRTRKAQIAQRASSPEFVAWIWRTKFADWLSSDESFFWVTGRPGSGKSTLMKHVADSRKTKQLLERKGEKWIVVHFFFDFRAGSSIANNLEGMLRSILYQVVQRFPDLARSIDTTSHDDFLELDIVSCLDYVCEVATAASARICAFIDGLDEFEGPGVHLIEIIHGLEDRAGFKLCLASRPYQIFESSFTRYAYLSVQEFNDESISLYVQAQWKSARLGMQRSLPEAFKDKIRAKARGVFLWARLAIDELLQDLLRGKEISALEAQLDEMPKEVEEMYQRVLDRTPAIMRVEAATLLYMIISSRLREVQIRQLYIAFDTYVRRQSGSDVLQALPVDLDDEQGLLARITNVLGDFVDVSTRSQYCGFDVSNESEADGLIPVVSVCENKLKLQKGPYPAVSLTHGTLKAFLGKNAWLVSHMCAELQNMDPEHLWLDIYLNALGSAVPVSGDHVCKSYTTTPDFVQPAHTMQLDEVEPAGESLLAILRGWSKWTPLLLLSVQYLLREVADHKSLDTTRAKQLGLVLHNPIMRYHLGICRFQSRFLAAVDEYHDTIGCSLAVDDCAFSFPYRLYNHIDAVGWDIFFSICHGLPLIALHSRLLEEHQSTTERVQEVFNHIWTKYLNGGENKEDYCLVLDRLLNAGAVLQGPHICSLLRCYSDYEESFVRIIRFSPGIVLSHADDCQSRECEGASTAFLEHWVNFSDSKRGTSDILAPLFEFLSRSGLQIDASFQGEPLLNLLLTTEKDSVCYMTDRMKKLIVVLKAGANPDLIGSNGNALQTARRLWSLLNHPPEGHWLHKIDFGPFPREKTFLAQKQEITKIVEMLNVYSEKRHCTETQYDTYSRFNNPDPLYYKPNTLHRLDPYQLFELSKRGIDLV